MSNSIAKCLQCNKEYKPLRADSKYCSPQCRLLAFRKLSVSTGSKLSVSNKPDLSVSKDDNLSVSKISVSNDDKVSVSGLSVSKVKYDPNIHERQLTKNEKNGITEYGKCHGCNNPVSHLICICRKCVESGLTHKSLKLNINNCR